MFMYKPILKRSQLPTQSKEPKTPSSSLKKIVDRVERAESDSLMISSRLLDAPNSKAKEVKAVIAPLFAQSYPYPPKVAELLQNSQESRKSIGAYKEINWVSVGSKVEFWITGETTSICQDFHEEVSCLALGELKSSTLPLKIRGHYILAVGIKNEISFYCLQSFTLRIWQTDIKYILAFSWQVQRIQFLDGFRLIFFSSPNYLQMVELGESSRVYQTAVPFYSKYLPTSFSQPTKIIENILYFRNRIYILFTEIKEKSWLISSIRKMIEKDAFDPYIRFKVIESYAVGDAGIRQVFRITEDDLRKRITNYAPSWKTSEIKIQNIFIDQEGKQEQLGIVTACGSFLTLRDMGQVYFSKDPAFLQNTLTYQSAFLLSQATPFSYKLGKDNNPCQVINSLGSNCLTLTKDSLLWAGPERVDGIHSENLVAEILLRRTTPSECYLFNSNEWAVFARNEFYTVRQLPIRHFLIAIIYANITQLNDYEPLSCQNTSYKKMIERVQQALTPQVLLRHLIQIIISGERHVSVNSIVLELIQRQLKGETAQNYRDWGHELKPSLIRKEIQVTTDILSKVWNLIFILQYKQIPTYQTKSKHVCDCSVYWMAIHQIYHQLISPLFKFTPANFKANRQLIENTFHSLTSLQNFFELKFKHEYLIRQRSISKLSKDSSSEDMSQVHTEASFDREAMDVSWVDEAACRTIATKIISENIIQVQQRLKKAVSLTLNLMTIYFGLSCNNETRLPSFGEVLRNKVDQQQLAKIIIANSDFATLVDINNKIPQLELKKDIDFRRWANYMELEHPEGSSINLQELSRVINSNYFQESLKLMSNRYDLQIKMLEIYEELILTRQDTLIQSNTLRQRNFLGSTLFPEDEQALLFNQREYFSTELDRIIQEQKRCLREAVVMLAEEKQASKWGKVMDQLIMIAANKPSLYDHLENELKLSGNLQKLSKLQSHKYKQYHKYAYNKKISLKWKPVERELFPQP